MVVTTLTRIDGFLHAIRISAEDLLPPRGAHATPVAMSVPARPRSPHWSPFSLVFRGDIDLSEGWLCYWSLYRHTACNESRDYYWDRTERHVVTLLFR